MSARVPTGETSGTGGGARGGSVVGAEDTMSNTNNSLLLEANDESEWAYHSGELISLESKGMSTYLRFFVIGTPLPACLPLCRSSRRPVSLALCTVLCSWSAYTPSIALCWSALVTHTHMHSLCQLINRKYWFTEHEQWTLVEQCIYEYIGKQLLTYCSYADRFDNSTIRSKLHVQ